jgi:serine/threonine protein kinase
MLFLSFLLSVRDLKPENVLIHVTGHIKLCDFGFATVTGATDLAPLHDGCGTAMYVAPEIAGGHMKLSHGLPVDWWSLGCILYEMIVGRSTTLQRVRESIPLISSSVTGEAPFGDTDKMSKFEIFNNINSGQVSFPLSIGGNLKSMIKGLLEKNQQQRFRYGEVKLNSWVSDVRSSFLSLQPSHLILHSLSRWIGNKSILLD